MDNLLKETYTEGKIKNSLDYSASFFTFLAVRTLLANLPWDFCFMYFYGPAYLWNLYLGWFHEWGFCNTDGNYDM